MKLELADFAVKDVRFSRQTGYNQGVLEIDKAELVALILEDKKIVAADLMWRSRASKRGLFLFATLWNHE